MLSLAYLGARKLEAIDQLRTFDVVDAEPELTLRNVRQPLNVAHEMAVLGF